MFNTKRSDNPLIPCPKCGETIRRAAMSTHWITAGHVNPSAHAIRVDVRKVGA